MILNNLCTYSKFQRNQEICINTIISESILVHTFQILLFVLSIVIAANLIYLKKFIVSLKTIIGNASKMCGAEGEWINQPKDYTNCFQEVVSHQVRINDPNKSIP